MDRRGLERLFRQHLGCSPLAYLQRARLGRAKQLLVDTDLPVPEVARHSGFRDGEHLAKVFRQLGQGTPQEYRRQFGPRRDRSAVTAG